MGRVLDLGSPAELQKAVFKLNFDEKIDFWVGPWINPRNGIAASGTNPDNRARFPDDARVWRTGFRNSPISVPQPFSPRVTAAKVAAAEEPELRIPPPQGHGSKAHQGWICLELRESRQLFGRRRLKGCLVDPSGVHLGVVFGVVLAATASAVSGCHSMEFCGSFPGGNAFRPAKVNGLVTGFRHDHICTSAKVILHSSQQRKEYAVSFLIFSTSEHVWHKIYVQHNTNIIPALPQEGIFVLNSAF